MPQLEVMLPVARAGLAILVNGLWQGPLIAAAAWLALYVFRRANAATRYAVWSLALLAVLIVPVFTSLSRITVERSAVALHVVTAQATHPRSEVPTHTAQTQPRTSKVTQARVISQWSDFAFPTLRVGVPDLVAIVVVTLWTLASLAIVVRLIAALIALERLKRNSLPLALEYRDAMECWGRATKGSRDVRICVSEAIEVPIAVGLFDSMILLPTHLVQLLEASEIDQITLHELGHLLRNDDWTNAIERITSALLFFNPAVWFIARQMDVEREVACDDYVLQSTGAVRPYAFCLTKMAEMTAWPHRPMPAPGVFVTRKNISIRIERLLRTGRAIGSSIAPNVAVSATVALIATFLVLRTMTPSFAYSDQRAPAPIVSLPAHLPAPVRREPPKRMTIVKTSPVASVRRVPSTPATSIGKTIAASMQGIKFYDGPHENQPGCSGCNFSGANLAGRDFSGHAMEGSNFTRANLTGAKFDHASVVGANFTDANLRNASFRKANLEGCNLRGAILDGADFTGAYVTGCHGDAHRLSREQIRQFLNNCEGCNFSGADLSAMDLRGMHLTGTNLANADLRNANLSGVQFVGVNFAGAHFAGAKLDGASFTGCNFSGVDLRGVDLSHVSLTGSTLSGAIWQH